MHLSICMISISRIELLAVQWAVSTPAPRAPGWSFTISCGFCVLQRVGTGYIQPLTSPQPQEKRAFSWEREDPLSGPTLSTQSHIPRDAFPTMNQTCYSVHFWKNAKGVGDHLRGPAQYSWQTWPLANTTVRPFSIGQGKYGEGPDLGERSGPSNLI